MANRLWTARRGVLGGGRTGRDRLPSGVLDVWGVTGGEAGDPVVLSHPGSWRVRLRSKGRVGMAQHGVPEGVEKYLAQFWPSP